MYFSKLYVINNFDTYLYMLWSAVLDYRDDDHTDYGENLRNIMYGFHNLTNYKFVPHKLIPHIKKKYTPYRKGVLAALQNSDLLFNLLNLSPIN